MNNGREIAKLEHQIDEYAMIIQHTPDPQALEVYSGLLNECQYVHRRLAGKFYHGVKESGKE